MDVKKVAWTAEKTVASKVAMLGVGSAELMVASSAATRADWMVATMVVRTADRLAAG